MNSTILALLVALALGGCAQTEPRSESAASPSARADRVDGARTRELVANGATLVDVRTPEEFASGHVEGAVNIPVNELASRLSEIPRDEDVVVYCRSGGRSARAASTLAQAGYATHDLGPMSAY